MAEKYQVSLGEAQETLLIPLYGRAVETRKQRAQLRDPKAVEMVEAIEYDFARFDGIPSLLGTVLRTSLIDWWVGDFLADHPAGTVVEVGCGLNTRFERLDNGQLSWIDLDLPDAMELRHRFFTENDRRRMLAGSVLDPGWVEVVKASPGPATTRGSWSGGGWGCGYATRATCPSCRRRCAASSRSPSRSCCRW